MSKKDKQMAGLTAEGLLEKYKGSLDRGSSDIFSYGRIPFYLPPLDALIGGGIPRKRITLLSGQSNAGKTYLAGQAAVSVQKEGGTVAWIDAEMSWDQDWMQKCGLNTDNILLSQPTTGEEVFSLIKNLMGDGVNLIVLDSIAGVVPSSMDDEDFSYNPIAWQARFVNQSFPRVMAYLKYGSALIAINQLRASLGPVNFLDSLPGGKAQAFFSHLVLEVRRKGWITEKINGKDTKVGFDITIQNRKSKAGGMHQKMCTIPFRFDGGFDLVETYIRESIKHDLVVQMGAWYKIFDDIKVIGMNSVKGYFLENPDKFRTLVSMVDEKSQGKDNMVAEDELGDDQE